MFISFGSLVNLIGSDKKGFDHFFWNNDTFALCDGANSCKNGGTLAENLSKIVATRWSKIDIGCSKRKNLIAKILLEEHEKYLNENLDAASTLVGLGIVHNGFELISIGDSYCEVFFKEKDLGWSKIGSMPRDIDSKGNPWQLIGSEVFEQMHFKEFNQSGSYCIFLLTDGAGNFLSKKNYSRVLKTIDGNKPNSCDLDYLSSNLAFEAKNNGSKDDVSVIIVFIDF